MGDILDQKLATSDSLRVFGSSFSAPPSPEILTNHNFKGTSGISNIWGPFYIPKCESLGGG